MKELERRGERFLTSPPVETAKRLPCVVRVYYASEGGELLAADSRPLSSARAHALESECKRGDSFAVWAEVLPASDASKRIPRETRKVRPRLVELPAR